MKLDYYIIKYIPDPEGPEWAIGVVANDGEKAYFRLLGVQGRDKVDLAPICRLSGMDPAHASGYNEWVHWFYSVVENEGANPAGFEKVMTRLRKTGTSITVDPGPSVLVPQGQDPAAIVDRLYAETVS